MTTKEGKKNFLVNEFFLRSWEAAVQHNGIYNKNKKITDEQKSELRGKIQEKLQNIINTEYSKPVSSEKHCKNLEKFKATIESLDKEKILEKVNIGFVQKLFNMLLKYYWCAEWIKPTPPHFPVDNINIKNAKLPAKEISPTKKSKWTKYDMAEYKKALELFAKSEETKDYKTLAEWEVIYWERA